MRYGKQKSKKLINVMAVVLMAVLIAGAAMPARATETAEKNDKSAPVQAEVQVKLSTPKVTSVNNNDYENIKVKWTKVSQADGYVLYRKEKSKKKWSKIKTIKSEKTKTYDDNKVKGGKTYSYKVQAYAKNAGKTTVGKQSKCSKNVTVDRFIWPCSSKRITSYYGRRNSPTAGASSGHRGMDIGAAHGSSIWSAADGKVIFVGYNKYRGKYVKVQHTDGFVTLYRHCSSILVSSGKKVNAGDKIAKVGSTGVSTGAHLHFEVLKNGTNKDPLDYVSR